MSALMIADTEIRQDEDGRFSLNDLHRASGAASKHQPANWLRLDESRDLADEIERSSDVRNPIEVRRGGRVQGTFVVRELVYAYAMWISPRFHLQVIRTFDSVRRGAANDPVLPPERLLPVAADSLDAARRISESLGLTGNQATLSANRMVKQTIGVDVMELAGVRRLINESQELNYTPTELGQKFDMTARQMNKLLEQCGLQRHFEYAKGKKRWELLPEGREYAVITDTPKKHSDGRPIQQILWKESVAKPLADLAHKLRAELPKTAAGAL